MSRLNDLAAVPPCIGGKPCTNRDCVHYGDCVMACKTPDWDAMESIVDEALTDLLDTVLGEPDDDDIGEMPDFDALDAQMAARSVDLSTPSMFDDLTSQFGTFGIPMIPSQPRDYSYALLETKLAHLSRFARVSGLTILAETVRYNSSVYPPVTLRVTVGGIPTFKRGVILYTSARGKDDKIFVDGEQIRTHGYARETFIIRDHSIVYINCAGDARRYAVDKRLECAFILSGHYPYGAMPMADAVILCKAYKYGTVIPSKDYRRMLRTAKEIVGGGF